MAAQVALCVLVGWWHLVMVATNRAACLLMMMLFLLRNFIVMLAWLRILSSDPQRYQEDMYTCAHNMCRMLK